MLNEHTRAEELDRLATSIAGARVQERMLSVDLRAAREHLEQLIEERWIALDEVADDKAIEPVTSVSTRVDSVTPGIVSTRRDGLMLALIAVTCTGIWAMVGAVVVLVLRAS